MSEQKSFNQQANRQLWDAVGKTDPRYTESVNDGRHTFTTIDAYYLIEQATELWGPYGRNWGLVGIDVQYHEDLATMSAQFHYPHENERNMFEINNAIKWRSRAGVPDGDFLKKLETNTISKALSRLGFGADVFLGKFDDDRYVTGVYDELVFIDRSQVKAINVLLEDTKTDLSKFNQYFKVDSLKHLQREDFDKAIAFLEEKKAKASRPLDRQEEEKPADSTGGKGKAKPRRTVRDREKSNDQA